MKQIVLYFLWFILFGGACYGIFYVMSNIKATDDMEVGLGIIGIIGLYCGVVAVSALFNIGKEIENKFRKEKK